MKTPSGSHRFSRTWTKIFIPFLSLALAGCGGGNPDNVAVGGGGGGGGGGGSNNGGNGGPPPQVDTKTFNVEDFPTDARLTLVASNQPVTETSAVTAQVVAVVDQGGFAGLAKMTLGNQDDNTEGRPVGQPACGTADVATLTILMGGQDSVRGQGARSVSVSKQGVRARFQELSEGAQESFFLITAFKTVTGQKVLEPNETVHCTIFAELDDKGEPCVSRSKALQVAEAFDSRNPNRPGSGIYDQVRAAFGSEWNQNPVGGNDGDTKVLLFFFRSETLGSNLYGYTSPADQSPDGGALSNKAEIVYINSGKGQTQTLSTLAHEFQHLINQNEKIVRQGTFPADAQDENVTVNEGLSQLSEEICGFDLDHDNTLLADVINDYISRPEEHEFFDFFAAGLGYGEGYLFLKYVREHFGDATIRSIATSPLVGKDNLDAQLPPGFDEVFRRWTVANYATNLGSGVPEIYRYPSGFRTDGSYQAGQLGGVATFPLPRNGRDSSVPLGAWSATYLTFSGGDGTDLSLTVNAAPGSPAGVIYEGLEGVFTSFTE